MRSLQGLRSDFDVFETEVLPGEIQALLGPGALNDLDRLVEELPTPSRIDSVTLKLRRLVSAPHAQIDPPTREQVEHREVLGHAERMVEGQHHDAGAEPDTPGPAREDRQGQGR